MIAILAAAMLQAAAPPGITFDEAVTLPANDLAIRMLGEAGRPYVGVYRLQEEQRSPPVALTFYTQPEASTARLCTMFSTWVTTSLSAPGQEALNQEPEGWRRYRKLVSEPPRTQQYFRLSGTALSDDFAATQEACGQLEPTKGPEWFSADDSDSATVALQIAKRLLPSEGGDEAREAAVTPELKPLLAKMRLDRLGGVRLRRCSLLAEGSSMCLVLYFSQPGPDDSPHMLTLIVSYTISRKGLTIDAVRAVDDFVYVP